MNGRGGVRAIVLVVLVCGLALAYLYQHSCSVRTTRELGRRELRNRMLCERAESLQVAVLRLSEFARLDSIWVAAGCPTAVANQGPAAAADRGSIAALGREAGTGTR